VCDHGGRKADVVGVGGIQLSLFGNDVCRCRLHVAPWTPWTPWTPWQFPRMPGTSAVLSATASVSRSRPVQLALPWFRLQRKGWLAALQTQRLFSKLARVADAGVIVDRPFAVMVETWAISACGMSSSGCVLMLLTAKWTCWSVCRRLF
jgi:hypothetical protein